MTARDIDVLGIGGIDRDLVLKVPFVPGHDEKVRGEFVGWLSGGPVANMACAASRLGLGVHAVCQVGDDGGAQFLADYREFGVNTDLCRLLPDAVTPFTVVLIDPTGEKVIIYSSVTPVTYEWDRLEKAMARTKVVFLLPHTPRFSDLAHLAHRQGAKVMTDIEERGDHDETELPELLREVDIASFNQFGVRSWTGQDPSRALARSLLEYGPQTILFTLGAGGCIGADVQQVLECPGIPVQVTDSTGAGDTFHGAFLAAHLRGQGLQHSLPFANAAGALSVTAMGPRGLLPTLPEVRDFQAATSGQPRL